MEQVKDNVSQNSDSNDKYTVEIQDCELSTELLNKLNEYHQLLNIQDDEYKQFCINIVSEFIELQKISIAQRSILMQMNELVEAQKVALKNQEDVVSERNNKIVQLQSDLQNHQRRVDNEIEKVKSYGIQKFALSMLGVKSLLDMALNDNSGQIDTLRDGLTMTMNQMIKEFNVFGIEPIDTKLHNDFNPNLEEAVSIVPSEMCQLDKNKIVEVISTGWLLNGRVIIPSKVIVSN